MKLTWVLGWVDSLRAVYTLCGNNPACAAEQRCVHQPIDVEFICCEKNESPKKHCDDAA